MRSDIGTKIVALGLVLAIAAFAIAAFAFAASAIAAEGDLLLQQTFGSNDADFGYDMQTTSDGGFVLAGRTYGFGASGSDFYLVRLDPDANDSWSTTLGTIADDGCNAVIETSDGGFLLVGWVDINSFLRKGQAIKVDASGQVVWQRFYLGDDDTDVIFVEDQFAAVLETANGDFVMAGTANSFSYREPWLVRVDADGDVIWQTHHPLQGHGKDYLTDLVETPTGDFAACGYSGNNNTFTDLSPNAFAFGSDGAFLWQRTLSDNTPADYAYGIGIGPDGMLAVVGKSSIPTLWRLRTDGVIESTTYYAGGRALFAVTATSDGGLLLAGTDSEPDLTSQAWIVKTDAGGDVMWDDRFGGSSNEVFYAAHERTNGQYALFGRTDTYGAGDDDYYLVLAEGPAAPTAVPDAGAGLGATISAYPNPFNPSTTIAFALPEAAITTVDVFSLAGRHVRSLLDGASLEAGRQRFPWDGRDDAGRSVAAGVYVVGVRADDEGGSLKLVLVK